MSDAPTQPVPPLERVSMIRTRDGNVYPTVDEACAQALILEVADIIGCNLQSPHTVFDAQVATTIGQNFRRIRTFLATLDKDL